MALKDVLGEFHYDAETNDLLLLYRRTKEIYFRTQEVLGREPRVEVSYSSTKAIEVKNGTQRSTKIFTV